MALQQHGICQMHKLVLHVKCKSNRALHMQGWPVILHAQATAWRGSSMDWLLLRVGLASLTKLPEQNLRTSYCCCRALQGRLPTHWIASLNTSRDSLQCSNLWPMQSGAGICVHAAGDRFDGTLMVCWFTDNRTLLQCTLK